MTAMAVHRRHLAGLALAISVVAALALAAVWLARPPIRIMSAIRADVTVECGAATGADADACRAWGDATLGQGAPSFTFEMDDLVRLRIDRPVLGLGSGCELSYFTSRYPEVAVWTEETACISAP
ncbi:MAG: hypothetical protein ACT4OQ_07720 [Chloroflexota bacterium]